MENVYGLMEIKVVKIMMTHFFKRLIHILHTLFHDLYKFEQSIQPLQQSDKSVFPCGKSNCSVMPISMETHDTTADHWC